MSEKLPTITTKTGVQESKKAASKEHCSEQCKKEQTSSKKMEDTKKMETEKITETHKMETSQNIKSTKISTSNKPDDSDEAKEVCHEFKDTSKISTSAKLEVSKDAEVCQMPKTTSEKSTSNKPDDSDEAKEIRQVLKDTSKIPTSVKLEASKVPDATIMLKNPYKMLMKKIEISKVSEIGQLFQTASEISTSDESDDTDEAKEEVLKDTSTSTELEASKVLEVGETPKITSEMSTSNFENFESVKMYQIYPKTTSEKSTSTQTESSNVPEENIVQKLKTIPEKTTPILADPKLEFPYAYAMFKSMSKRCEESEDHQVPEVSKVMSTFINLEDSNIPEVCQRPKTTSETSMSEKLKVSKVRRMHSTASPKSQSPTQSNLKILNLYYLMKYPNILKYAFVNLRTSQRKMLRMTIQKFLRSLKKVLSRIRKQLM